MKVQSAKYMFNAPVSATVIGSVVGQNFGVMSINGVTYHGRNLVSKSDGLYVDGARVQGFAYSRGPGIEAIPPIEVTIRGSVDRIEIDSGSVKIEDGDANSINLSAGTVHVEGDVKGSVTTVGGIVEVMGSIGGSVQTVGGTITSGARGSSHATRSSQSKKKKTTMLKTTKKRTPTALISKKPRERSSTSSVILLDDGDSPQKVKSEVKSDCPITSAND